jgi:hypothetical protein
VRLQPRIALVSVGVPYAIGQPGTEVVAIDLDRREPPAEGMVVETRQRRALVSGVPAWWE